MKEFETAAGRAALVVEKDIEFTIDDRKMTAHPPTTGQLALFLRADGGRAVSSLVGFMSDVLDPADWRWCEMRLHQGVDVAVLSEVATWLIGEWSGRPTLPASDSSDTPSDTGRKSTAKQASVEVKTS